MDYKLFFPNSSPDWSHHSGSAALRWNVRCVLLLKSSTAEPQEETARAVIKTPLRDQNASLLTGHISPDASNIFGDFYAFWRLLPPD